MDIILFSLLVLGVVLVSGAYVWYMNKKWHEKNK